jgi:hypothetical protein
VYGLFYSTRRVLSAPILDLRAFISVSPSTIYPSHSWALSIYIDFSVYMVGLSWRHSESKAMYNLN